MKIHYPMMTMYRKLLLIPLFVTFLLVSSLPNNAYALNPKVKVLLSTGSYGAIGGTLLGAATLAFGTSGRTVAQGASIGLWSGLLFGSYIILSHMAVQNNADESVVPYGGDSPYETGPEEGGSASGQPETDAAGNPLERWNPYVEMRDFQLESGWANRLPRQPISNAKFYINVLNVSF